MELNIVSFREQMADPINRVMYAGERIVLQRRGKSVAAVVSMDDLALLKAIEDADDIKAALKARKEKGSVPLADIKVKLGMKGK
ncbi:MAG: type II toxin-antitoxin system Phd/YefM family antitoxin [Phycisphaerales bacterium]|jgi:antitoxin (DNA-binding transcriptional repressor) of toxin-antitoxin stability system|nr:type II toxin-antitoxin system Phd/YefM family antitoxin [Phycisphaerales bacterium]